VIEAFKIKAGSIGHRFVEVFLNAVFSHQFWVTKLYLELCFRVESITPTLKKNKKILSKFTNF